MCHDTENARVAAILSRFAGATRERAQELKVRARSPFVPIMPKTPFSGVSVDSLQPPTKSPGRPLLIAAVAMAAGIGGMLWWKLGCEKHAQEAVVPVAAASSTPILDRAPPPPPPPPPVATEAPKASSAKSAQRNSVGAAATSTCARQCTGTATADLQTALRAKAAGARSCYERALRQNAMLQGRVTVAMRVAPEGRICSASLVSDGLGDPGVANCVVGLMRSGSVPAPSGGCVDVQVPVSFVARQ